MVSAFYFSKVYKLQLIFLSFLKRLGIASDGQQVSMLATGVYVLIHDLADLAHVARITP